MNKETINSALSHKKNLKRESFPPGTFLFACGDAVNNINLMHNGGVRLLLSNESGNICHIDMEGEIFLGSYSYVSGKSLPYSIVSNEKVSISSYKKKEDDFGSSVRANRNFGVLTARTLLREVKEFLDIHNRGNDLKIRLELLSENIEEMTERLLKKENKNSQESIVFSDHFFNDPLTDFFSNIDSSFSTKKNKNYKKENRDADENLKLEVYGKWINNGPESWDILFKKDPGLLEMICMDIAAEQINLIDRIKKIYNDTLSLSIGLINSIQSGKNNYSKNSRVTAFLESFENKLKIKLTDVWGTQVIDNLVSSQDESSSLTAAEEIKAEKPDDIEKKKILSELRFAGIFTTRFLVVGILILLCFCTGFTSLIFETLWLREFSILLGNTTYTTSAIISSFLTGLALGAVVFGKLLKKSKRGILWFAVLEAGVALSIIGLSYVLKSGVIPFEAIGMLGSENFGNTLYRFFIGFILVLIPTFLMGGTLPALSRHFEENNISPGLSVGLLYGMNTLGACAGTFITGFYLIRELGMAKTQMLAVNINFAVALASLVMIPLAYYSRIRRRKKDLAGTQVEVSLPVSEHDKPISKIGIYVIAAGAGFVALTYEIILFRILGYLLGNRTYAVSTLLAIYLLGISIGSLLISRLLDVLKLGIRTFSTIFIAAGIYMLATIVFFPDFLAFAADIEAKLNITKTWHRIAVRFVEAGIVVLPPTLLFGAAFPLLIRKLKEMRTSLTEGIGRIYFFNTIGSVAGTFLAGLILIPVLGTYRSMVFLSITAVLLGYRIFFSGRSRLRYITRVLSVLLVVFLSFQMYRFAESRKNFPWINKGEKLIDMKEDALSLITVRKDSRGLSIYADSTIIGYHIGPLTEAESVQRAQGHIPSLLHPNPVNALVVGLGAGITSGAMSLHPEFKNIETIEIYPSVIDMMKYFKKKNEDILKKTNNSKIFITDGRYYVYSTKSKYDIISVNITNPYLPGCAAFYTVEFLKLAKSKLNKGGLYLTHLYGEDWKYLLKTLSSVFKYIKLYRGYKYTFFAVASMEDIKYPDYNKWNKKTVSTDLKKSLKKAYLNSRLSLNSRERFSVKFIKGIKNDPKYKLHVDDLPYIEYRWMANPFYIK